MELGLNVIVSLAFPVSALFEARNRPKIPKDPIRKGLQGDAERDNWSENLPCDDGRHAVGGVVRGGQNA
jgi:hypothetical protein